MTRTGPEEGCTWTVPKFSTHVTLAYLPLGTRTQPEGCPLLCLRWEHSVLEAQVWEEVCVIGSMGRAVVGVRHCPFVGCLSQNGSCFGGPPLLGLWSQRPCRPLLLHQLCWALTSAESKAAFDSGLCIYSDGCKPLGTVRIHQRGGLGVRREWPWQVGFLKCSLSPTSALILKT